VHEHVRLLFIFCTFQEMISNVFIVFYEFYLLYLKQTSHILK